MSVTIMIDGCIKRNHKFGFQLQSSSVGFELTWDQAFFFGGTRKYSNARVGGLEKGDEMYGGRV